MLDHPVTNAEYKLFIDGAGYRPPSYWVKGQIPAGLENWPVVFVNRYDVAAYLAWRTKKEGRIYRLPTASEFDYASRPAAKDAIYPWGNDAPEGKANYDAKGDRNFAEWRRYLKPVKSYAANERGLYDMAGTVWQMVDSYPDPALERFKYRVEHPESEENSVAGGSWARAASYLKCGVRSGQSSGIRHPDVGFRVVREPAGATHFQRQPRRVIAAPAGSGKVYIGWQFLSTDKADTGFHIYRTTRRDTAGERITTEPVLRTTDFTDEHPPAAERVYYRVRAVNAGCEGPPSEWAAVAPAAPRSGLVLRVESDVKQGRFVPVFGDLDGDGIPDVVLRYDNGNQEMSRDPGQPVEVEAFTSFGRSLWRRSLVRHDHCFGNANNVPVVVYDMDGDGKSEVLCRLQEGDETYLAILDGMTGRVRRKTPWTAMVSDMSKSSTRVHLSVAYLDGKLPALITQTGLYENEIFDAFDRNLRKLWSYRSLEETNGSGSHHIDVADVDGDGRDEVFNGTMLLNPDGRMRWALYRQHPDIVAVKHILPGAKNLQVFYAVETTMHAGAYLVDAKSGKVIWKVNREDDPRWSHAHMGWAADIWEGSPGMEMLTNRDGHPQKDQVLFSAEGKILLNPFPGGWYPVNWTGGKVRDLMTSNGRQLGKFDGKEVRTLDVRAPNEGDGGCNMVADLAGDYRDEVVCIGKSKEGGLVLSVYSNIDPAPRREITRTASRAYRQWVARNMGGGYPSYFEWQP
jgi:rhamnogalacturonan endolyase